MPASLLSRASPPCWAHLAPASPSSPARQGGTRLITGSKPHTGRNFLPSASGTAQASSIPQIGPPAQSQVPHSPTHSATPCSVGAGGDKMGVSVPASGWQRGLVGRTTGSPLQLSSQCPQHCVAPPEETLTLCSSPCFPGKWSQGTTHQKTVWGKCEGTVTCWDLREVRRSGASGWRHKRPLGWGDHQGPAHARMPPPSTPSDPPSPPVLSLGLRATPTLLRCNPSPGVTPIPAPVSQHRPVPAQMRLRAGAPAPPSPRCHPQAYVPA